MEGSLRVSSFTTRLQSVSHLAVVDLGVLTDRGQEGMERRVVVVRDDTFEVNSRNGETVSRTVRQRSFGQ